ncbi:MAG: MarR family transcriptional regulator [Lachnospiraceae bacterium]|nr:MarR family transcriptional regulator [Lachnospiraceae bacterium]MDD3660225.1 MarR family transcriptional regulator [Lachnospiraceae bacterium]
MDETKPLEKDLNKLNKRRKCAILLKHLHHGMHKNFNKDLESLNLTSVQGEVLFYLFHNQDKKIYQKTIEESLKISNPTVTGILQRMEEKELISRVVDESDARYRVIVLCSRAIEIRDELAKRRELAAQKLFQNLKEEEIEELERVLTIMIHNLGIEEFCCEKGERKWSKN